MIENIFLLMGFTETAALIGDVVYWGGFFVAFGWVVASYIVEQNQEAMVTKLRGDKPTKTDDQILSIFTVVVVSLIAAVIWPLILSVFVAYQLIMRAKKIKMFFKSFRKQVD